MTTTMMRLRQHLGLSSSSSPAIIYTSAIARLGNNTHRRRTSTSSTTLKQLLLLLLLLALLVFVFLIPSSVLFPPARPRIMSSSASDSASSAAPFEKPRAVVKKALAESQPEGQGATVRRSIGRHELRNLDPFLMLDSQERKADDFQCVCSCSPGEQQADP